MNSKRGIQGILFLLSFLYISGAMANPTGAEVVAGQVQVTSSGKNLLISQSSSKAIINWQQFNIARDEHTHIQQPTINSVSLNRVVGGDISNIQGKLSSNGQLMLINPAGIIFGKHANIDVSGLIASTANISNQDFLSGNYSFLLENKAYNRKVINQGTITVRHGGLAALVAPGVENHGVINARLGRVALGSGSAFTVDLYGDGLVHFVTPQNDGPQHHAVINNGKIFADGGRIQISTNAAQNVVENVINLNGVVQANNVYQNGGTIVIGAYGPRARVNTRGVVSATGSARGGEITIWSDDASHIRGRIQAAGGESGGFIETSGRNQLDITGADVSVGRGGSWLLDPGDVVINDAYVATILGQLNSGATVTVQATNAGGQPGNITIDTSGLSPVLNWSTGVLNLQAASDVTVNSSNRILLSNGASLNITAGRDFVLSSIAQIAATNNSTINIVANRHITTATESSLVAFDNSTISLRPDAGKTMAGVSFAPGTFILAVGGSTIKLYDHPTVFTQDDDFTSAVFSDDASKIVIYNYVKDLAELQSLNGTTNRSFALWQNIDASASSALNGGAGFVPIGTLATPFYGNFDGLGYSINHLTINRLQDNQALFGTVIGSTIENTQLQNANIKGARYTAPWVGRGTNITLKNLTATNIHVTGGKDTSTLVGLNSARSQNHYQNIQTSGNIQGENINFVETFESFASSSVIPDGALSFSGNLQSTVGGIDILSPIILLGDTSIVSAGNMIAHGVSGHHNLTIQSGVQIESAGSFGSETSPLKSLTFLGASGRVTFDVFADNLYLGGPKGGDLFGALQKKVDITALAHIQLLSKHLELYTFNGIPIVMLCPPDALPPTTSNDPVPPDFDPHHQNVADNLEIEFKSKELSCFYKQQQKRECFGADTRALNQFMEQNQINAWRALIRDNTQLGPL